MSAASGDDRDRGPADEQFVLESWLASRSLALIIRLSELHLYPTKAGDEVSHFASPTDKYRWAGVWCGPRSMVGVVSVAVSPGKVHHPARETPAPTPGFPLKSDKLMVSGYA